MNDLMFTNDLRVPRADAIFKELFESKDFRAQAIAKGREYTTVAVLESLPALLRPQMEAGIGGDLRATEFLYEQAFGKARSHVDVNQTTISVTGSDLVAILANLKKPQNGSQGDATARIVE